MSTAEIQSDLSTAGTMQQLCPEHPSPLLYCDMDSRQSVVGHSIWGSISVVYLLCLLGDLDMTMWSDIWLTVSLKDTTGSEILISAPPMKSSCRSFKQISRCNSPAPAAMQKDPQTCNLNTPGEGKGLWRWASARGRRRPTWSA